VSQGAAGVAAEGRNCDELTRLKGGEIYLRSPTFGQDHEASEISNSRACLDRFLSLGDPNCPHAPR
jgi:hypothetical protein